jgi:hypothetical protein
MLTRLVDKDDSGGLTDGTPHDNTWLQRLNDTIDSRWSMVLISATGTVNNLDIGEADFVVFTNAADLTVTGILAPSAPAKPGKVIRCWSAGAGVVYFAHMSGAGGTQNRLFNLATSAPTPIFKGSAMFAYNQGGADWILIAHEQGKWLQSPFSAANFVTLGGGTWVVAAGNVTLCHYRLSGNMLTMFFNISGTTVGGTPAEICINNPAFGGFVMTATGVYNNCLINEANAPCPAGMLLTNSGTQIGFSKSGLLFTNTSSATTVQGQITVPVN